MVVSTVFDLESDLHLVLLRPLDEGGFEVGFLLDELVEVEVPANDDGGDEACGGAVSAVEVDGGDESFEGVAVDLESWVLCACGGGRRASEEVHHAVEVEFEGDALESFSADDLGAGAGEEALLAVWEEAEEHVGDDGAEEGVAEELEAFVVGCVGVGFVGESLAVEGEAQGEEMSEAEGGEIKLEGGGCIPMECRQSPELLARGAGSRRCCLRVAGGVRRIF